MKKVFFSVLFLVLCFFSAIFLVHREGRGSGMVPDTDLIIGDRVFGYGEKLKEVVTSILQDERKVSDIDFNLQGELGQKISELDPGLIKDGHLQLPMKAFDGQINYAFSGANRISSIGTDAPEIIFITWPIREGVCREINRGVGLDRDWATSHILTNPPNLAPINKNQNQPVTEINASGNKFVCVQDKSGIRYYIHTLVKG
jgi:hypothetical protein